MRRTTLISAIITFILITTETIVRATPHHSESIHCNDYNTDLRSAVWSVVTSPEQMDQNNQNGSAERVTRPNAIEDQTIPKYPENGMSRIPGEDKTTPSLIFPEMTPVQRPGEEEDFLDTIHGRLSYGFLATATWLDSFFGNDPYEVENNQSQFKFRYVAFREDHVPMRYRPEIDFRLSLPQMRKKAYLTISGDPNEDIETSSSPVTPKNEPLRPEDRNMTTSLHYFFRSTERRSYSIRSGAKFHNGKPILFLGPRARYFMPLDSWGLRFIEEVLWYTDTGWLSRTRFDLERNLPRDFFFRTTIEGLWSENKNGYPYSLSFALLQPLDRNRAISYEWVNSFQTRPTNELDEVLFVFRYRQRIWRDWLYLEIAPQERYPRDRSFRETPGILFKLEMIIGNYRAFIF